MIVQTNTGKRLTGFFRGQVLKRSSSGFGKCKIWIPGIYSEQLKSQPDSLPDAEQASPLFGGILAGNGMFSWPNIGATVWCFFANEDQNQPVYFASTLGTSEGGAQFKACEPFQSSDDGAYFHKITCGKSTLTFSEMGNTIIENHAIDQKTMEPKDTIIIMDQSGKIQIKASSSINIESPQIKIDASKSVEITTGEFSVTCNSRHTTTSPYVNIKTNETAPDGENGVNIVSDTINLDAENGCINIKSEVNGAQEL